MCPAATARIFKTSAWLAAVCACSIRPAADEPIECCQKAVEVIHWMPIGGFFVAAAAVGNGITRSRDAVP